MNEKVGYLKRINEFIVQAELEGPLSMSEEVWVGNERLTAEVIELTPANAVIQVYEDTSGVKAGEPVYRSGLPFAVTLGPGLLGNVFDGIERPLTVLKKRSGIFIQRGLSVPILNKNKHWFFKAQAKEGASVSGGDVLGMVQETSLIVHYIMVPPELKGVLTFLAKDGEYTIDDTIAVIKTAAGQEEPVTMTQRWHIRAARPVRQRLNPATLLITGQRVIDTFFPIAKGGSAAVPGGFGTGKTVLQHSLAQWSDANIIVYVGCGERGNEMTEVLEEFPKLNDPWSHHPLMERTVLIANTSNMPVAARESSIYTGITIAEYYRDQGYHVALMADSTSRWAEALREISGRLNEIPTEEGYPAYLPARIAAFYERAGHVVTLGGKDGSVTIIGAVSPPGGDFSEPVSRYTQRFISCWWALNRDLAHSRHFPAIDWLSSYSLQLDAVKDWWSRQTTFNWPDLRRGTLEILQDESNLQQLVQLVGTEALSDEQQLTLLAARLLREGFLMQSALSANDAFAVPEKQLLLLNLFFRIYRIGHELLASGVGLNNIQSALDIVRLVRLKDDIPNDQLGQLKNISTDVLEKLAQLKNEGQTI